MYRENCFLNFLLNLILLGSNNQVLCFRSTKLYILQGGLGFWPLIIQQRTCPGPHLPSDHMKASVQKAAACTQISMYPGKASSPTKEAVLMSPWRVFHFLEKNWKCTRTERRKVRYMTIEPSTQNNCTGWRSPKSPLHYNSFVVYPTGTIHWRTKNLNSSSYLSFLIFRSTCEKVQTINFYLWEPNSRAIIYLKPFVSDTHLLLN